ncbi:MAG: type VI secretion system contractile sheath small subunit, partial [Planctomycetes bacterium]|nr:type VI secretion system contractile sheath small subunit [Planctomycetota bacterium]
MSDDAPDVNYTPGANTPEVSERRPYTVVLISDFQAGERLSRLSPVDKDDFAELLARAQPGRPIAINDPFGDGPDWEFKLTFDKLKTFEPAGLLAQVPGARTRLAVREKIAERGRGNVSADELANALNSAADMDGTLSWLRGAAAPATGGAETPPATPG